MRDPRLLRASLNVGRRQPATAAVKASCCTTRCWSTPIAKRSSESPARRFTTEKKKKKSKKRENSARILKRKRESEVWGTVIDQIGKPRDEVEYVHVFDRGGDNFEVYCRLLKNRGQWVIRASKMNRYVLAGDSEERMPLKDYLPRLQTLGHYTLSLRARPGQAAREAQIEVRVGRIKIPRPQHVSPWVRSLQQPPIAMNVIEVVEVNAPRA